MTNIMKEEDLKTELEEECHKAGGVIAWARGHELHPYVVYTFLNGERPPGPGLLNALGVVKVTRYVRFEVTES